MWNAAAARQHCMCSALVAPHASGLAAQVVVCFGALVPGMRLANHYLNAPHWGLLSIWCTVLHVSSGGHARSSQHTHTVPVMLLLALPAEGCMVPHDVALIAQQLECSCPCFHSRDASCTFVCALRP